MKAVFVLLGLGVLIVLGVFAALFFNTDQVTAQDPIAQRLANLAQRGVKVQTTPPSLPPPAGMTLSPSGALISPRPPALSDEELDRAARARLEQTPLPPRVKGPCKNDPELFAYITTRQEALNRVKPVEPTGFFPAMVNFKRPISEAELERLVKDYGLQATSLYYATNGDSSGNFCYRCDTLAGTEARLRNDIDNRLRVTGYASMHVVVPLQDLRRLNAHPDVLLVDPGTLSTEGMEPGKYQALFPVSIFWRYEQACR